MDLNKNGQGNIFDQAEEQLKRFFSGPKAYGFFSVFIFGLLAHFGAMASHLDVTDGLWHNGWYVPNGWEVSIGRWFWHFLQQFRGYLNVGYAIVPMALFWFALLIHLLIVMFRVRSKAIAVLMGASMGTAVELTCLFSNNYLAPTFVWAAYIFVAAMAVIFMMDRFTSVRLIAATLMITFGLGVYQAYIGCAAMIALLLLYRMLLDGEDLKKIGVKAAQAAGCALVGMILYYVIMQYELKVYDIVMATYKGASEVSFSNIFLSLPNSLHRCISNVLGYYLFDTIIHNTLWHRQLLWLGFFCLFALTQLFRFRESLKQKQPLRILLALLCVALLPIAVDLVLLLIPGNNMTLLMSVPTAVLLPCCLALMDEITLPKGYLKLGASILCVMLIWTFYWQDQASYLAKEYNLSQAETVARDVYSRAVQMEDFRKDMPWVFYGVPENIWDHGQEPIYGRAAGEYTDPEGTLGDLDMTWPAIFQQKLGIQLETYFPKYLLSQAPDLVDHPEIDAMPCYPAAGCVRIINDKVIVKITKTTK